jgi:hypothetical protein
MRRLLVAFAGLALCVPAVASGGFTLHGTSKTHGLDVELHLDRHLIFTEGRMPVWFNHCQARIHAYGFHSTTPTISHLSAHLDEHGTIYKSYHVSDRHRNGDHFDAGVQVTETAQGRITFHASWSLNAVIIAGPHPAKCNGGEAGTLHAQAG